MLCTSFRLHKSTRKWISSAVSSDSTTLLLQHLPRNTETVTVILLTTQQSLQLCILN